MAETADAGGKVEKEAQNWAMLCHLSALAFFIVPTLGHLLGPLIVWLLKRADYPQVDENGKEALNFQLSMTIYGLTIILLPLIFIADIVLTIIASVKVANGEPYRYPLTIRFLQ